MKRTGMFMIGYAVLLGAIALSAWKLGVLASIGTFWSAIAFAVLFSLGLMAAVALASSNRIEVDRV